MANRPKMLIQTPLLPSLIQRYRRRERLSTIREDYMAQGDGFYVSQPIFSSLLQEAAIEQDAAIATKLQGLHKYLSDIDEPIAAQDITDLIIALGFTDG